MVFSSDLERVLSFIDSEAIVALARRLVLTASYGPETEYEGRVARVLAETLEAEGLSVRAQPVRDGRANLLCSIPGRTTGPALILNGHMDTVPPPSDPSHVPGDVRDGRLWGRGSADMKGAVAAMTAAMIAIRRAGVTPPQPLLLAAVVAEETSSLGAWSLGREVAAGACAVVGEPTSMAIVHAHRGVERLRVTVHGRAAHGATPHLGVSAIARAARAIVAIEDSLAERWTRDRHPGLGTASLNVGTIRGGVSRNVVPDACAFDIEKRYLPGDSPARIGAEVTAAVEDAIVRAGGPALSPAFELHRDDGCREVPHEPLETPREHPLVTRAAGAIGRVLGRAPKFAEFPAFTDAAVLQSLGATAIVLGPGDLAVAHTDHEFIETGEIIAAARLYAAIALDAAP
jgi:acetylornithine deacetylase/succinyl-diaminopimelate desuccinylase